jgi:predicted nucleotidyltransferase
MADHAARVKAFFEAHTAGVSAVYLYGSQARGDARPDSDVDVGVLFEVPPRPTLLGQPLDLEDQLERAIGRRVDLVTLNSAPVDLRIRVLREGRLLIDPDRAARIRFEVATRNEAFDLEPILREYRATGAA